VIAIAHRLSTLRNFNWIVVLRSGQVNEEGAPQMLLRRGGIYSELIRGEMARLSTQQQAA
jgi:ATP-binding cassette, subfamily B, bacterial